MEPFSSILYSAVGFAVGWLLGREHRAIEDLRQRYGGFEMTSVSPTPRKTIFQTHPWFGVGLIVLAIGTIIAFYVDARQDQKTAECVYSTVASANEITRLRTTWADEDRAALLTYATAVSEGDFQTAQAAARSLRDTYETNNARRAQTPVPTLSDCYD